jgi:hypothetical protein
VVLMDVCLSAQDSRCRDMDDLVGAAFHDC